MSAARRRRRTLVAIAVGVALGSVVVSSAASLGGLRPQALGAASAAVQQVDTVTLDWTPRWQAGGWRVGELEIAAPTLRGFRPGDTVRVAIHSGETCETVTRIDTAAATLTLDDDRLTQSCGSLPSLTTATTVALAVTGADGETLASNLGDLTGSLAGFTAPVVAAASAEATTEGGYVSVVHLDVPGVTPADLTDAHVSLAVTSGDDVDRVTLRVAGASATDDGAVAHVDVVGRSWSTSSDIRIEAALSLPHALDGGAGTAVGVALAGVTVESESRHAESAIDPAETSPGIEYERARPWGGANVNSLNFWHTFTITNTSGETLDSWWIVLDTTLPPMWGLDPTDAQVVSMDGNITTLRFEPASGRWTIGGANDWSNRIRPGESRSFSFSVNEVPLPAPDPSLFETTVSADMQELTSGTLGLQVTTSSEFNVPWRVEIDLADLVCADALGDHRISFTWKVEATPIEGSSTRYVLEGLQGTTQFVAESRPLTIDDLAVFTPDPSWDGTCRAVS